jgi:iron complex outermembrane receptor protein
MNKHFPIAALMLSASPFVLLGQAYAQAQDAAPIQAQQAADATPDDIQKVVIVSTGSRGSQRTMVDTPVPVDVLSSRELTKTGQATLDKSMQFRVPSFNTVQTPVNDATSLLDPYEIRNMGPSRVLILINGKRKNMSSLVYTQTSPGRGGQHHPEGQCRRRFRDRAHRHHPRARWWHGRPEPQPGLHAGRRPRLLQLHD